jgi:hypothetical protein
MHYRTRVKLKKHLMQIIFPNTIKIDLSVISANINLMTCKTNHIIIYVSMYAVSIHAIYFVFLNM